MKKIKLNNLEALDSALTRDQLKGIMGGSSSSSHPAAQACNGLSAYASCSYSGSTGTCIWDIDLGLYCSIGKGTA